MMNFIIAFRPEDVVGAIAATLIILITLIAWASRVIKQSKCKHDGGVWETKSCDAVCQKCDKNLGFIGNIGDKNGLV